MKRLFFYVLVVLFGTATGELLKPLADYRDYRFYRLDNGMRVLSVHHPRIRQAGFSVAVGAGSLHEPLGLPGLAHYLEHMLFLGTEKYPDPQSFDKFMSEHGGVNNAFTDDEMTVFHNQIEDIAFEEGLDRFSQFFKKPLFNADLASREVHAIDAEHRKNIPIDDERVWFTIRSTANGPISHFSTGNVETLQKIPSEKNINVINALREFHKKYYCAHNMVAATMSPRTLDEQEKLVREKFGDISSKNGSWLGILGPCPGSNFDQVKPFGSSNTGKFIHIQGNGAPSLWITFALKSLSKEYTKQPISYMSYLLEYRGKGGLASRLQNLGLATSVDGAVDKNSVGTLYGVKIGLTAEGAAKPQKVIEESFAFINMFRKQGVDAKILSTMQRQSKIDFHLTEPIALVMEDVAQMSANMLKYHPDHVLSGSNLIMETDGKLMSQLLQSMTPANTIIAFSDNNFPKNYSDLKTDPYYGVLHKVSQIPNETMTKLESVQANHEDAIYPPPLLYVSSPKQLSVLPLPSSNLPKLAKKKKGYEIWWQGHGEFRLPRISVHMTASVPADEVHLQSTTQALLHSNSIVDSLAEETVDMQNCGMEHSIQYQDGAYHISFKAFSPDQISWLMSIVAKKLKHGDVEDQRFQRVKQSFIDVLEDNENELAYQHAMDVAGIISTSSMYGRDDFLRAAKSISSFAEVKKTTRGLKNVYIDAFVKGNIDADKSVELVEEFISNAGFEPLEKSQSAHNLVVALKAPVEATLRNPIPKDENHVTLIQYQYGVPSIPARVDLALIGQMLNRRLYDNLRTDKQLGYIVAANTKMDSSVESISCLVEGSAKLPDEVEKNINSELQSFSEYLKAMPEEEFNQWKTAIQSEISAPVVNFDEETNRNWEPIHNRGYCFNKRELELQYITKMLSSPSQLHSTYAKLVQPQHRLVVKMFGRGSEMSNMEKSSRNMPLQSNNMVLSKVLKSGKARVTYNLASVNNEIISQFQSYMGFWPYETICELPDYNTKDHAEIA